ncbi:hypothetical protein [Actinomadura verrucosospora]|uniref:Uncharacterized protein n=1 Tax=Actinomadura verrucosospora TaxID=46165 RepID=A0A7D4A5V3_ACTVE|nr:hypothetical protein [Actinomadura verrucosospora]QKG23345.1 hypothetical protein ACTIVE_4988 [Actinomadura verrucosospora]
MRRGPQLLVWALVLTVFCGLALLSGQADGIGSGREAKASAPPAASAPSAGPPASAAADGGGRLLAAPAPLDDGGGSAVSACKAYDEQRDFLPLNRWTDFSLFVVDNSWIFKTQLFVSMISSLMFMAASMAWRIIGILMGLSYSFDMICSAAGPINSVGRSMSLYASWFLIPGWVFVLMAVFRRWTSAGRGGPASALRLLTVFLAATGMIFFIGDQSEKNQDDPTAPYTLPWMAETVQDWVGTGSDALFELQKLGRLDGERYANPVFYDTDPKNAGKTTCAALDDSLYERYRDDNAATSVANGRESIIQLSKMWEVTLVRSWETAQFGEGTPKYPSSAHAACRLLEANADVELQKKLDAYDLATGNDLGTTKRDMMRGYYIDPEEDEQTITVAWGACEGAADGLSGKGPIPQWQDADVDDIKTACQALYGSARALTGMEALLISPQAKVRNFYFNGSDELNDKLGKCVTTKPSCHYSWQFVAAWLGKNQAQRLTQGLMSMIVSFVFLFVLGPIAIGQAVSSVALAGLVMLLPVTLLLLGLGLPQGKRLMKLTGAAAMGDLYFTFAMTGLTMFVDTTTAAINAAVDSNAPTFFEQVAQGTAPLVALYLFRRLSKILGMGDISTTTGALGFAGTMVLRSSGDRRLSRNASQRVSQSLGRLGMGRARLGALDERSLQRRLLNNAATRSVAGAAGRGVKRAARPLTDWAKDRYEQGRAGVLRGTRALQRKAASGSPAQRAGAYAALTAGMAGLTVMAPPAVLATLPLMAFTGAAAALRGGQAAGNLAAGQLRGRGGGGDGPAAAGLPLASSARTGLRQADDWHRNIIRVGDAEEQRKLMAQHAEDGLEMLRARLWGDGYGGGLNPEFTGFGSDEERARGLAEMAAKTGLKPEQLMVGDHGLAMPVPVTVDRRTGRRVFAQGTSIEQASHPVHYLDPYTLRRQMVDGAQENDDQYIARLTAQLRERGYVTDDGEFVDVFAAHGYDTRLPEVRERVAAFISGGRDDELSKIAITSRRSEDAAVAAAYEWARGSVPGFEQRHRSGVVAVEAVMEAAKKEIGDFGRIRVELPDGTFGTAGGIHRQIEQQIQDMAMAARETQSLYDLRSNGLISNDFFRDELSRLFDQHQNGAQDLDRLSAWLRDAVDASTAARGVCALRADLANPNIAVDTAELSLAAEKLNAEFEKGRKDWHEAIDRLVGSVSQKPGNASAAADLVSALDDFRDTLDRRVKSEETKNRGVIQKLRGLQDDLDEVARLTKDDPRLASNRPTDIRRLLNEMYDREVSRK